MENKKLDFKASGLKNKPLFKHLFPILKRIALLIIPFYVVIGVTYLGFFSKYMSELALQISAVLLFLLGLPLSAGLRVDQMSLELGGRFSREVILIFASLITWLNLLLILGFRAWLKIPSNKS